MTQEKLEPIVVELRTFVPYRTTVGATGSKFLVELRDNKRIMGIKCPQCGSVYVPPRLSCPGCFSKMDEWVELNGKGTISSYTVVNYTGSYQPYRW